MAVEEITVTIEDALETVVVTVNDFPSGGGGAVNSVNGQTGAVVLDSDDIDEATVNRYYTTAREASAKNRDNHTGTQLASTISDFDTASRSAVISQSITNGVTNKSPSENAVFDEMEIRDTANRNRANHTGTQLASTISDFAETVRSTILTGFSAAVSWARITATDTVLQALGKSQKQIDDLQSTSVTSYTLVVNGEDSTKFDFSVVGVIRNSQTGEITEVNATHTAVPFVPNSNNVTYIGHKSDGTLTQQSTRFTSEQKYNHLAEWVIVYNNGVNINALNFYPNTSNQLGQQLHNFMKNSGVKNIGGGNLFAAFGTTILNVYKPVGGIIEGVGWGNLDSDNPNEKFLPAILTEITFDVRKSNGTHAFAQTVIDPTIYEPNGAGVVSAVPLATDVTVFRFATFNSNLLRVQLGQKVYGNIDDAVALTGADTYLTETNIADNGIVTTFLAIQKNCTSWSQTTRYRFFIANAQGNAPGSGVPTTTFNSIYQSIIAPQLSIDDSKGEFIEQSLRALNTSKVRVWKDNAMNETAFIRANGKNSFFIREIAMGGANSSGTSETVTTTLFIPANTITAGVFDLVFRALKSAGNGVLTNRLYVNTTPNLTGSPILIGTAASTATAKAFPLQRYLNVHVANGTGLGTAVNNTTSTAFPNDLSQHGNSVPANLAINWTVDQYIVATVQNASASDVSAGDFLKLTS